MTWLTELGAPHRRASGHVIVLPGIEGFSRWNRSIVRGLHEAGLPHAFEIHDWTYGRWLALVSLRARRRHRSQAQAIAQRIVETRREHPEAPIWLIGHSGGGAIAVMTLERLPDDVHIEGAILLAPGISRGYDLTPALAHTRRGIWNFSSWGDAFFLIFGTLLMGTIDGRHTISAGASGFRGAGHESASGQGDSPKLVEVPWRRSMLGHRHFAGHFGCVHHAFVREWIAPILAGGDVPGFIASNEEKAGAGE